MPGTASSTLCGTTASVQADLWKMLLDCAKLRAPLSMVTIPVEAIAPEVAFACRLDEPSYFFSRGATSHDVGIGSVYSLECRKSAELPGLIGQATDILRDCECRTRASALRVPRFLSTILFDAERQKSSRWQGFAPFCLQLPRFRYVSDRQQATLSLAVRADDLSNLEQCQFWFNRTLDLLKDFEGAARKSFPPASVLARTETPSHKDWLDLVRKVQAGIGRGELEKVVLAREIALTLSDAPTVDTILTRLLTCAPDATRFAIRRGECTFLGATPERLVYREGAEVQTEALAGSVRASDKDAAQQLLVSEKDRHEHALVVRQIVQKLEHTGAVASPRREPVIRRARHILHLATPIVATLRERVHVLELAARLHPTPAVGGVPMDLAMQFLRENEGFDRGLYAGSVGWFDAVGDGEFMVALRSGLVCGNEVVLYAGAGIVADSDPEREFEETQLKLESLLEALNPVTG